MRRYLTEHGIEEKRLLLEDQSTSTRENLAFSERFLDKETDSVGIVTNSFHIYRATMLAKTLGYAHASGIPASSDLGMQPHNVLREICAVLAEWVVNLRGYGRN